jgi:hypothetical protein
MYTMNVPSELVPGVCAMCYLGDCLIILYSRIALWQ